MMFLLPAAIGGLVIAAIGFWAVARERHATENQDLGHISLPRKRA